MWCCGGLRTDFPNTLDLVVSRLSASYPLQDLRAQIAPPAAEAIHLPGNFKVELALAEALSWLETQGIIVPDRAAPTVYALTRRGRDLRTRADLEVFRKNRSLPRDLLQDTLANKVHHLFLRGDHDVAVFQAFKEVEVAVRKAANRKGAGYPDDLLGINLMRKAFHPDSGPLTDMSRVPGEREAESHLFSGAIGHAKNPASHRDVEPTPQEAARLIVFASYLLSIVEQR
jgi:Protein of unknown function (Hypoth_ymh)